MTAAITIHGFETSNNIKVRVALGFKDIPYTFKAIDPASRDQIVELSGQRLTPVLTHGDVILFDSSAILRYLEANFRGRPSLFGTSMAEQWAIEDLELFARHTLAAPMMEVVHTRVTGGKVDDAMQARCAGAFTDAAGVLAKRLAGREWLVGDAMSAADVTAAAVLYRIRQGRLFELPASVAAISAWESKVLAFDAHLKRA